MYLCQKVENSKQRLISFDRVPYAFLLALCEGFSVGNEPFLEVFFNLIHMCLGLSFDINSIVFPKN